MKLADLFGNSIVHKDILLICDIFFDPLLTETSSQSLKCSEGNWSMYMWEVSDNHAWIRILPSSVHDIFCTFNEIIQFKQINSYPQADMYHPFYSKVLIVNLNEIQFLNRSIENRDSLHRNSARRKTINNWFICQCVFIEIWSTREVWRERKICKSRSRCSREQI